MRRMEKLNRGLIAARMEKGIYLSWRYLGDEPDGMIWHIYRRRKEEASISKTRQICVSWLCPPLTVIQISRPRSCRKMKMF